MKTFIKSIAGTSIAALSVNAWAAATCTAGVSGDMSFGTYVRGQPGNVSTVTAPQINISCTGFGLFETKTVSIGMSYGDNNALSGGPYDRNMAKGADFLRYQVYLPAGLLPSADKIWGELGFTDASVDSHSVTLNGTQSTANIPVNNAVIFGGQNPVAGLNYNDTISVDIDL